MYKLNKKDKLIIIVIPTFNSEKTIKKSINSILLQKLENQIEASKLIGCRFHAARGFMSVGESKGGLPPDSLVEDEKAIIKDCQRK